MNNHMLEGMLYVTLIPQVTVYAKNSQVSNILLGYNYRIITIFPTTVKHNQVIKSFFFVIYFISKERRESKQFGML